MNGSVLIVEDSPAQAALLQSDLAEAGFEVTVASSGEEALDDLTSRTFDIVLSDVVMPGIDGYELCRRTKHTQPDLPFVLLTSLTDPIEIVHGLEAGADNFLRKPYDPRQLVLRVQQILYHRQMRASGKASIGLEVMLRDKRFLITAERQQILDLLMSSFEDLVSANTELRQREEELRAAQARLRSELAQTDRERRRMSAVLRAAPTPLLTLASDGRISEANDQITDLLDVSPEDLVGAPLLDAVTFVDGNGAPVGGVLGSMESLLRVESVVEMGATFDVFVVRGDVRSPVIVRLAPVRGPGNELLAFAVSVSDVGALAEHDSVTKLPKQALFADRVAGAAADAAASGRWLAVAAVVLHRLRAVRESVAPQTADALLAQVASRVRSHVDDDAVGGGRASVAFLGGDVFAVVLPDLDGELDAVRRSQELADRLNAEHLETVAFSFPVAVTVGVAVDDGRQPDPVQLVTAAVHAARRRGAADRRGVEMADPVLDARADDWLRRVGELRDAIEHGELTVHYQPEISLRTGEPTGAEALVRWEHPERGLLMPDEFLPLARESGLVARLGWCVLEEACRQLAAWQARELPGADTMTVAVNVDASQLSDADLRGRVQAILERTGVDGRALVLELTEHGITDDLDTSAARLRELKGLGARIAIDDFGTGYSSLTQLRRLPADFLKIDRSFVAGMNDQTEDQAIVAATVRLARTLGIESIAEGVENEEQLAKLRLLDCDQAQGYFWTKPLPSDDLERWWLSHHGGAQAVAVLERSSSTEELSTELDDVVSYLTHELRSPLAVIVGWTSMALERGASDMERYLAPVIRQAEELDRRISSLAEMRDLSRGAMRLRLETADLSEVVSTLVADMREELAPHPIQVHADLPAPCRVDVSRVVQATSNLLGNAAKFSPGESPIDVDVAVRGTFVEVTVVDRGPGVPEDRRPELFRRFARLGSRHRGMGVGLYLVRAIARAHGGDSRYEPVEEGGSRFTIAVPQNLDQE